MTGRVELYGGGTAMGAVQVYPAQRLAEDGWPEAVHGVSVGSLTAAMRAAGKLDELEAIWRGVRGWWSFQLPALRPWRGVFTLAPLRRLILRHIKPGDLEVPCWVHVVDLATEAPTAIAAHQLRTAEELADALIASCSQTGIHQLVSFRDRWVADGGARHTVPIPQHRPDEVVAVACSPIDRPWGDNPLEQDEVGALRGLEVLAGHSSRASMRRLKRWAAQGTRVTVVQPRRRPGDPFDASPATTRWRLEEVGPDAWSSRRSL